ncbi:DUF1684 domain-containing protein [Mesonia sp. JHPTF-M18]|uniref:DUF1684 domain-containing protein n=2 Tax=Mesonia aestuariivivens TaxID=2796128 RepID=A0ABS6VZI4_9FLAO|nr:DUF1684 domain-containing protein [Mesonia aestuariivivens]
MCCFSLCVYAQEDSLFTSQGYQEHLNEEFANKDTSPLIDEDLENFKSLDFFEIDSAYIVKATFHKIESQVTFVMPTTTERKPIYVKYGELNFILKGKELKLNVYQSQRLSVDPQYKDYLFIPFTDLTNGETTYGGGRYLDFKIPQKSEVILDFNRAYNPYCAYNGVYSCPIPPEENDLPVKIEAGVKKYKKHSVKKNNSVK